MGGGRAREGVGEAEAGMGGRTRSEARGGATESYRGRAADGSGPGQERREESGGIVVVRVVMVNASWSS